MSEEIRIPSYNAVIPSKVLYSNELEFGARCLFGSISTLAIGEGYCWASNHYLASLFNVEERTIQFWLKSLIDQGFIEVEVDKKKFQTQRRIWVDKELKEKFTKRNTFHADTKCIAPGGTPSPYIDIKINNISKVASDSKNEGPKGRKVVKEATADAVLLTDYFLAKIKERAPKFKEPNLRQWQTEMDLLLLKDGRSIQEIKDIIDWSATARYFKGSVLCPASLRKKFDQMQLQQKEDEERGIINKNRQWVQQIILEYPKETKGATFDAKYVINTKAGKEIPFTLPEQTFRKAFMSMFGGKYDE